MPEGNCSGQRTFRLLLPTDTKPYPKQGSAATRVAPAQAGHWKEGMGSLERECGCASPTEGSPQLMEASCTAPPCPACWQAAKLHLKLRQVPALETGGWTICLRPREWSRVWVTYTDSTARWDLAKQIHAPHELLNRKEEHRQRAGRGHL